MPDDDERPDAYDDESLYDDPLYDDPPSNEQLDDAVDAHRDTTDGDSWTQPPSRAQDAEVPPSQRAAARRPEESSAWQPPTADPAGPGPQPPPEPVNPPADAAAARRAGDPQPRGPQPPDQRDESEGVDEVSQLSDLEAAVAALGLGDDEPASASSATERGADWPPPASDAEQQDAGRETVELPRDEIDPHAPPRQPASTPRPESLHAPPEHADPAHVEGQGADPEPADEPTDESEQGAPDGSPEVDLSDFTARGGKVSDAKRRRRPFGRGR